MENSTDGEILLDGGNVSVNDVMAENPWGGNVGMSLQIPAGKSAVSTFDFFYDDTISDESALSEITDIDFKFIIYGGEHYDTLTGSGIIAETGELSYTP